MQVECTTYGAYAVLFGLAIWVLPRKFDVAAVKMFFFPSIIALFFFASLNIAFDLIAEMHYLLAPSLLVNEKPWMVAATAFIIEVTFFLSDILGDTILIYRVYAVWGFRKKILFPILLIMFGVKVFELIVVASVVREYTVPSKPSTKILTWNMIRKFTEIFGFVNAFANLLMTLLIAGRVWWISKTCATRCRWHYRTIAIITESGIIYPLYLTISGSIMAAALEVPSPASKGVIAMGLGPTLIAVRVGLGSAYDHQSLFAARSSDISLSTDIESRHHQSLNPAETMFSRAQ
ncbi:hypothetical protein D9757_008656 [Collybiopsis confluens]|uniref:Uncharacterized protein n=1 Tax=Collybiopsis confluens TaxID=2823264 RepID=A0A8H5M0Q9_9AGAR|nr:hypothetical protein D9757_008656 [Collybiopsis confluens]